MDYAIIIFLNLLFLGLFYVLFSIRLGRALEKTRRQGIPREFYENVEMVVRYLDTTLESITQKNETFYRLVSRADELKKELEALLSEYEKSSRRKKKRSAEGPSSKKETKKEKGTEKPARTRLTDDVPEPASVDTEDSAFDRLLQQTGEDRIEWSDAAAPSDLADLIGARKDRKAPDPAPAENLFTGLGRFTRRILGISPLPSMTDSEPEPSEPSPRERPSRPGTVGFENERTGYAPQPSRPSDAPPPASNPVKEPAFVLSEEPKPQQPLAEKQETSQAWLSDVVVPDLTNVRERATFVRSLLQRDVSVEEIASFTGIAVGEIDFIKKVMESQGRQSKRGTER